MWTFEFTRSYFLWQSFNIKLKQLIESGIVNRMIDSYYEYKFDLEAPGPSILTIAQLKVGFLIFVACLLISTLSFLLELIIFSKDLFTEAMQSIHTFIIFKSVIEAVKGPLSFC